jgi:mRNA interferase MazF
LAAAPGDYGKPRPTLALQSDLFDALPSVTICPLTSFVRDDVSLLRIGVEPGPENGLRKPSQIAVDKIVTLPRSRFGKVIGRADDELMLRVSRALALFLGLGVREA